MQPQFLILLVDDDPLLLTVLNRAATLSFPEASFHQVHSVSQAIAYIHELDYWGPKLVFLDVDLGLSLTGYDFLAFLRSHPEGRLLSVVMLTVDQSRYTIEKAYSLGVSSYLVKPDGFAEWNTYLAIVRLYWHSTATMPHIRFHKLDYWK